MKCLLVILLAAATTTQLPAAAGKPIFKDPLPAPANPDDPVEREFKLLTEKDDAAHEEVDKWIRDNEAFAAKGAGTPAPGLNQRIRERLKPVREAYEAFIKRHTNHVGARLAFASLLEEQHEEAAVFEHLDKARELDPKNPAVWNNLANYHGHNGDVKKAFDYYTRAIELNATEPVYFHNYGTTVYLFRKDAMEHFKITEQQVFDKALELYAGAIKLDPTNFPLASDVAQSYYGIKPVRLEEGLKAWTNALNIAHDEIEREGVYLHFARLKLHAGRFAESRAHLNAVTNAMYDELKNRLVRNLNEQEAQAKGTNAAAVSPPEKK